MRDDVITKHALTRFRERSGCKNADKAKATLRRMIAESVPAAALRTANGKVVLFPKHLRCYHNWVLVIQEDKLLTCYQCSDNVVLPMKTP